MAPKSPSDSSNQDSGKDSANRGALPFEPKKNRKQAEKKQAEQKAKTAAPVKASAKAATKSSPAAVKRSDMAIPDAVSKRMVRRMALFCGIPTFLGISTFITSYLVIVNDVYDLPTYAVLLLSAGFFGLGVLGLSYGVLSASWDEDRVGNRLGFDEFKVNFGRMTAAWRSSRKQS
jgi:hypothetical protein